ncbi:hypothetical protein B5F54_06830 [Anaeromassilibacillus sp. An250]|nr:hypothetical protein B5F54_06830 [Anaeromassilibacillus sp. An250]
MKKEHLRGVKPTRPEVQKLHANKKNQKEADSLKTAFPFRRGVFNKKGTATQQLLCSSPFHHAGRESNFEEADQ